MSEPPPNPNHAIPDLHSEIAGAFDQRGPGLARGGGEGSSQQGGQSNAHLHHMVEALNRSVHDVLSREATPQDARTSNGNGNGNGTETTNQQQNQNQHKNADIFNESDDDDDMDEDDELPSLMDIATGKAPAPVSKPVPAPAPAAQAEQPIQSHPQPEGEAGPSLTRTQSDPIPPTHTATTLAEAGAGEDEPGPAPTEGPDGIPFGGTTRREEGDVERAEGIPRGLEFSVAEVLHGISIQPIANLLSTLKDPARILEISTILERTKTPAAYHRTDIRINERYDADLDEVMILERAKAERIQRGKEEREEGDRERERGLRELMEAGYDEPEARLISEMNNPIIPEPPVDKAPVTIPVYNPEYPFLTQNKPQPSPVTRELRIDIHTLHPATLFHLEVFRRKTLSEPELEVDMLEYLRTKSLRKGTPPPPEVGVEAEEVGLGLEGEQEVGAVPPAGETGKSRRKNRSKEEIEAEREEIRRAQEEAARKFVNAGVIPEDDVPDEMDDKISDTADAPYDPRDEARVERATRKKEKKERQDERRLERAGASGRSGRSGRRRQPGEPPRPRGRPRIHPIGTTRSRRKEPVEVEENEDEEDEDEDESESGMEEEDNTVQTRRKGKERARSITEEQEEESEEEVRPTPSRSRRSQPEPTPTRSRRSQPEPASTSRRTRNAPESKKDTAKRSQGKVAEQKSTRSRVAVKKEPSPVEEYDDGGFGFGMDVDESEEEPVARSTRSKATVPPPQPGKARSANLAKAKANAAGKAKAGNTAKSAALSSRTRGGQADDRRSTRNQPETSARATRNRPATPARSSRSQPQTEARVPRSQPFPPQRGTRGNPQPQASSSRSSRPEPRQESRSTRSQPQDKRTTRSHPEVDRRNARAHVEIDKTSTRQRQPEPEPRSSRARREPSMESPPPARKIAKPPKKPQAPPPRSARSVVVGQKAIPRASERRKPNTIAKLKAKLKASAKPPAAMRKVAKPRPPRVKRGPTPDLEWSDDESQVEIYLNGRSLNYDEAEIEIHMPQLTKRQKGEYIYGFPQTPSPPPKRPYEDLDDEPGPSKRPRMGHARSSDIDPMEDVDSRLIFAASQGIQDLVSEDSRSVSRGRRSELGGSTVVSPSKGKQREQVERNVPETVPEAIDAEREMWEGPRLGDDASMAVDDAVPELANPEAVPAAAVEPEAPVVAVEETIIEETINVTVVEEPLAEQEPGEAQPPVPLSTAKDMAAAQPSQTGAAADVANLLAEEPAGQAVEPVEQAQTVDEPVELPEPAVDEAVAELIAGDLADQVAEEQVAEQVVSPEERIEVEQIIAEDVIAEAIAPEQIAALEEQVAAVDPAGDPHPEVAQAIEMQEEIQDDGGEQAMDLDEPVASTLSDVQIEEVGMGEQPMDLDPLDDDADPQQLFAAYQQQTNLAPNSQEELDLEEFLRRA